MAIKISRNVSENLKKETKNLSDKEQKNQTNENDLDLQIKDRNRREIVTSKLNFVQFYY